MTVFVMDGYVTEHVNMLFDINKLYWCLCKTESDEKRYLKMNERRLKLLWPIFNDLNKEYFQELWQKLLVELAEISNDIFEGKFETVMATFDNKGPMNAKL